MTKPDTTQKQCQLRWEALKAATVADIEAIDRDTPWSEREPLWWIEMMEAKASILRGLKNDQP